MLFLLWTACGGSSPSAPPVLPAGGEQPDIILVSVDTLRADHLGSYGYHRSTSPFLDELASQGVRFAQARSPSPWTLPSHTTLLTGLMPMEHMVVDDQVSIDPALPRLPERFQAAGYATAGIVTTLFVSDRFGFAQGFDHFEDFDITDNAANLKGDQDAEKVIREALSFIKEHPDQPVMLFLHFYDVHYPYGAPAPFDEAFDGPRQKNEPRYKQYFHYHKAPLEPEMLEHKIAQYDEEILYVDSQLRELKEAMDAAGRKAIWSVSSDHGEEFFERGSWGHAHTLNPEQLHIPWIMSGPSVPAGVVVEEAVGLQDVAPTLLDLVGLDSLGGSGISLKGHLGESPPPADRVFLSDTSRFRTHRLGIYQSGWRLDWNLRKQKLELYGDPLEAEEVSAQEPERVAALRSQLLEALGTPWEASAGELRAPLPKKKGNTGIFLDSEGQIFRGKMRLDETGRFALLPPDAALYFGEQGPWKAAGGPLPGEEDPVRYLEESRGGQVELSNSEIEALKALGYMQGDE